MSDLTVSLGLEGDVTIETVAKSAEALHRLLVALAGEVGPTVKIEWVPEDLRIGSLHSTYQAKLLEGTTVGEAGQVVENYGHLGERLERHEELPNSQDVVGAAERLLKDVRASAHELVLGTASGDAVVDLRAARPIKRIERQQSIGSATGRVQTLSGRTSLQFVLYEEWTDQAVRCYAQEHQAEELRAIWGRRVRVKGALTRIPRTRRILSIRNISVIEALPEEPPARFESARGAIQWRPQDLSPAQFIRELRDAE